MSSPPLNPNPHNNDADKSQSFYMPGEFKTHQRCLMLYPHNNLTFRSQCQYGRVAFRAVATAISNFEPVTLFCNDRDTADALKENLGKTKYEIDVYVLESNDTWARDTSPTFLISRLADDENEAFSMKAVDWGFNAYGGEVEGCYWPCDKDVEVASQMTHYLSKSTSQKIPILSRRSFILEGGSIHVDGEGTVLTTEECLLNPNRNPQLSRKEIETVVLSTLGAQKIIWLPRGLYNDDDTNGHIDNICCFVEPGHVLLAWTDDKSDAQYEISCEALKVLTSATDACGRSLKVTKLHNPPPLYYTQEEVDTLGTDNDGKAVRVVGERLAASYANFYIANGGIVVPGFDCPESDDRAVETLRDCFPGREVIQVPGREIVLGGGNVHCITAQVPAIAAP